MRSRTRFLAELDRALDQARQADAGLRVEREAPYVHVPPMETAADEPVVRATVESLTQAGRDPTLAAVAYATDASMLASIGGLPAVVLGPGDIAQAHTNDEWIELAELEAAVGVYRGILRGLCRWRVTMPLMHGAASGRRYAECEGRGGVDSRLRGNDGLAVTRRALPMRAERGRAPFTMPSALVTLKMPCR